MWEDLTTRVAEAKANVLERQRCASQLEKCQAALEAERANNAALRSALQEEEDTSEKLEGMSITHLFHRLLGNLEEKEEDVQKSIVQTRMKLSWSDNELSRLEAERDRLQKRLEELAGSEEAYERLLSEKEARIRDAGFPEAQKLEELVEQRAEAMAQRKEVAEAKSAAQAALSALTTAADELRKAENWGTFDMLGGGMITTAIKRSHMDDANDAAMAAQTALKRLERELRDVRMYVEVPLTSGGFSAFADYFFDGLITDWLVQREIRDALNAVEMQLDAVREIEQRLSQADADLERRLASLEEERRSLIERL
ncbi:MAG: hypothetical protein K6T83_12945 [Alicyclobacillus sp.]|nr:hypothetical protein [Alicyclobacillus sp.]